MFLATRRSAGGRIVALWLFAVPTAIGCGDGHESAQATQESHIKALAILYGHYTGQHRGQPPRNETDFKQFIDSVGPEFLEHLGVANVDELFVSERDDEPYVILYGRLGPPVEGLSGPITIYEKTGDGQTRFVASSMGIIQAMTDEEFRRTVPDAN